MLPESVRPVSQPLLRQANHLYTTPSCSSAHSPSLFAGSVEGAEQWQGGEHDCEAGAASATHPSAHQGAAAFILHHRWSAFWSSKTPLY